LALFPETTIEPPAAEIQGALGVAVSRALERRDESLSTTTLASLLGATDTNSDLAPAPSSG
jgi:hypothetical protein